MARLTSGQTLRFRSQYDLFLKNLNLVRRIRELTEELGRARRERDQARKEAERLQKELERLDEENQRLRKELETAQRAAKRQAAPFSRGQPKSDPKPPGRKSGAAYGRHYLAIVYTGLDDRESAFQWLEKAYQDRVMRIQELPQPHFDRLRSDGRFQDLMQRIGLPLHDRND